MNTGHADKTSNRLPSGEEMVRFEMYISGRSESNSVLISSLRKRLKSDFPFPHTFLICDVLKDGRKAVNRKIIATPTIVKVTLPTFRIIGDLTQLDKLMDQILILNDLVQEDEE